MLPASAEIKARYQKVEIATDKFGRTIKVQRLRLSEQLAVRGWSGTEDRTVSLYLQAIASVRGIDELIVPSPQNMAELTGTIDILDAEGAAAAIEAYVKISSDSAPVGGDDAAKNSQATPPSET